MKNSKQRTRNMQRVMDKREQGKDISVIDYAITDKKYFATTKGMHNDQNKKLPTFKIEKK